MITVNLGYAEIASVTYVSNTEMLNIELDALPITLRIPAATMNWLVTSYTAGRADQQARRGGPEPAVPSIPNEPSTEGESGDQPEDAPRPRTVAEVMAARRSHAGCCSRYCDQMACECLADAKAHEERATAAAVALAGYPRCPWVLVEDGRYDLHVEGTVYSVQYNDRGTWDVSATRRSGGDQEVKLAIAFYKPTANAAMLLAEQRIFNR